VVLGGFLVGFGSAYAGGCTSGHAISGLANLELPSLIALIGFFAGDRGLLEHPVELLPEILEGPALRQGRVICGVCGERMTIHYGMAYHQVAPTYYSAPPGWIGRRVQVQWDARQVRLLDPRNGQLLREHLRQTRGRHRIQEEDRPQKTPLGTMHLLARADRAGSQIGVLCRGMHREHGEIAVRRIQGVLSLAKKYGVASVDDACAAALEVGVCEYHFVRRYLERNPQLPLSLRQVDPLIRQLTLYRDFIQDKTKESET